MVKYNFDIEKQLLIVDNSGRLDFESMKTYFLTIRKYAKEAPNLLILENALKVEVKFSAIDIPLLGAALNKSATHFDSVVHAVILKDTTNVAYAMLINDHLSAFNYTLKVFDSHEAAHNWLFP
jgi:hypothetical protein